MDSPTPVAAGPGPGAPPSGPRRLRRRPDDGWFGGVCAGLAEYFNVDPVIVRIAAVMLLLSGPGGPAYIIAWIFVPAARGPVPYGAPQAPIDRSDRGTQVFGAVLIVLAVSAFWGDWWSPARHWLLPLGLIGVGAWLLFRRDDADPGPLLAPPPTPTAPPTAWAWGAAPGDAATAPSPVEGSHLEDTRADTTPPQDLPADATSTFPAAGAGAGDAVPGPPWGAPTLPVPPPIPPTPLPPRRRLVGPIVLGVLLMWAGVAFLADVAVETGLAGGLLIIGLGFVLGSFVGGSRVLILPALLVGAALLVSTVVDIPLSGPVGEQRWSPQAVAQLASPYEMSLGEGTLDLAALDIPEGDRVEVAASVGMGHLVVLVSDDVAVEVTAEVGAGESDVLGQRQDGVGFTTDQRDDGGGSSGTLALELQVGLGQIEVRRIPDVVTDTTTTPTPTTAVAG